MNDFQMSILLYAVIAFVMNAIAGNFLCRIIPEKIFLKRKNYDTKAWWYF